MLRSSFGKTPTLAVAAIAASVIAYCGLFIPTAYGGGKEKVEFDGEKVTFRCEGYNAQGRFSEVDWGHGSPWCRGNMCGSRCAAHVPRLMTMKAQWTKDIAMRIYVHEYGYYLEFTGDLPPGVVRTTDPLILEFGDGTALELLPLCERSDFVHTAIEGQGSLPAALSTKTRFCSLYDLSREQLERLGRKRITGIRVFFTPNDGTRRGGVAEKLKSTDDGRYYIEYRRMPPVMYSISTKAYCLLKAEEEQRVTLPRKTVPQMPTDACRDGYLEGTYGCKKACSEDMECAAGTVCSNGSCLSKCSGHDDCPGCGLCVQNFCASRQMTTLNPTPWLGDSVEAWQYHCGRAGDVWERIDEMVYSCVRDRRHDILHSRTFLFATGPGGVPSASAILTHRVGGKKFWKQLEEQTGTYGPSEPPRVNKAGCEVYTWAEKQEYRKWEDRKFDSFFGFADCGKAKGGMTDSWELFATSKEAMSAAARVVHKKK